MRIAPIVQGRRAHPDDPAEIEMNEGAKDQLGMQLGERVRMLSLSMDQFATLQAGGTRVLPLGPR